jgi:hypothetical protein
MLDRISGKTSNRRNDFESSIERLEKAIRTCDSGRSQEELVAHFGAFLSLSRRVENLTISLDNEVSILEETLAPQRGEER